MPLPYYYKCAILSVYTAHNGLTHNISHELYCVVFVTYMYIHALYYVHLEIGNFFRSTLSLYSIPFGTVHVAVAEYSTYICTCTYICISYTICPMNFQPAPIHVHAYMCDTQEACELWKCTFQLEEALSVHAMSTYRQKKVHILMQNKIYPFLS